MAAFFTGRTLGIFSFVAILVMMSAVAPSRAQLYETRAAQAMLVDVESGSVLFSKDADAKIPPASLAKLMTMEVVFNALKSGRLTLQDKFQVSENAWRTGGATSGGSTMFADLDSEIALEDLIQGVIVQSANDGCIVIAEGMAGSEANFARLMTQRAQAIGLTNSVFTNSTGLPDPAQTVTVRDLVRLARHIQREYPEFYRYYSQPDFTWNGITQRNRNPLLSMDIGADGMKTGFTDESGYAIVGSVVRDGRRLIVAMSGLTSERERAEEARKLLEWGARAFEARPLFAKGEVVGHARLFGGASLNVPLTVADDLDILVPITNTDRLTARIVYQGPIPVPVEIGAELATLRVFIDGELAQEVPLVAAETVEAGPLHRRALDAVAELMLGWL